MGTENACDVCGGSETMLVDGYYYCAECGTQDTNVRETVIEHTALADGTFAFVNKQKFSVKIKDGVQMSPEWYKWHAYNFIMAGLTEELLRLVVSNSVKAKVLWIWAKYIRQHQDKEQMFNNNANEIRDLMDSEHSDNEQPPLKKNEQDITFNIIVTILNLALNLDRSKYQLSHLRRFILNGHLGVERCREYVPKEINTKIIRGWMWTLLQYKCGRFSRDRLLPAMKRCMALDLGPYLIPDLDCIVDNQLKELCLPNDLINLVLSLMHYAPVDYLTRGKKAQILPDFEGLVMSYILVALKMCFGLDDDYDQRLSEAVEKINEEENHLKAYKWDMFTEPSDRLFSFREWCNYLLFRKYMHCNYNSCMAKERGMFLDDYVFMEHSKADTKEVLLSDEVTMDIVNKIPQQKDFDVIPVSKFEPSLTPLSTVTDVICQHLRDIDARRLLSEDFTQYSLNYACRDLVLPNSSLETANNIFVGVSESRKTYNELLGLHFTSSYSDDTKIFVRNCENKNWFKTKRPTAEHIVKVQEAISDRDSDLGYDSNLENAPIPSDINESNEKTIEDVENKSMNSNNITRVKSEDEDTKETKLEVFDEEEGGNIFDDDFLDMNNAETNFSETVQNLDSTFNETNTGVVNFEDSYYEENNLEGSKVDLQSISSIKDEDEPKPEFDPTTFDRESTIKALVIAACQKYKIPIPYKFRMKEPKKRKLENPNIEPIESKAKRARTKSDETKKIEKNKNLAEVNEIVTAYYHGLEYDIMHEVSQHIKSFVANMPQQNIPNDSIDQDDVGNENNDLDQSDQVVVERGGVEDDDSDDGSIQDPVYKGDAKFDEKTHDAKQLYLKVKDGFETEDLFDLDSDEEINKLLDEQINNPGKPVDKDDSGDDSDDLPLSRLRKPKKRRKEKFDRLLLNPESISTFNYWFKHYISRIFKKHELTERFDAEIRYAFPKSFGFVLFECAAVLDCSAYSLYRHMTDIEEKMLKKDGYIRTMKNLKDTGIRIERRDYETRKRKGRRKSG